MILTTIKTIGLVLAIVMAISFGTMFDVVVFDLIPQFLGQWL
jgi:uncharacterized membrane protein YuzA (DUF378 family)